MKAKKPSIYNHQRIIVMERIVTEQRGKIKRLQAKLDAIEKFCTEVLKKKKVRTNLRRASGNSRSIR